MNVDKIYLSAYQQESSTGGRRCESANNAISEAINKGMFVVGSQWGDWKDDINSWSNEHKLPFMTATCEFSRYDDPERVSAGEHVLLKENGGFCLLLLLREITAI